MYVVTDGEPVEYMVSETKIVPPTEVSILDPVEENILTIYTCNDFNNDHRLVVIAKPIK